MRPSPHPMAAAIVAHLADAEPGSGQPEQPRTHRDSCICRGCYELALLARDMKPATSRSQP